MKYCTYQSGSWQKLGHLRKFNKGAEIVGKLKGEYRALGLGTVGAVIHPPYPLSPKGDG